MEWLKENWFKIAALIVILIIGLGYIGYLNTKEQNRQNELAAQRASEEVELLRQEEQAKKEYSAERKSDCLNIYQTESDKWNNVTGWRYAEEDDECFIEYKSDEVKSEIECDEDYPVNDEWGLIFFRENFLCKQGRFENSF